MPAGLSLTLLGGLRIVLDGVPIEKLLTSKAAALLSYLAVTGRPHSRAALAGLLWSETAEEKARASLRTALAALNRHLPAYLRASRLDLAFDPTPPHWVDASAFRQEVERILGPRRADGAVLSPAEAAGLQEAVDLYQGDFLADCAIADAPLFEEWLVAERERLRQLALRALYSLSVHYTATGAYYLGIQAAERLLALAPWQEEGHRQLMHLLALAGRRSAALAQYEVCRRLLAEELGVEPTAETTALYQEIRQTAVVPPSPPPRRPAHNLPAPLTPLIGREEELARLVARLTEPGYRLVTVVGPGGVGKTRLALAVAERVLERFPDGVWWVPLADTYAGRAVSAPGAVRLLVAAIARALGLVFSGQIEPVEQLVAYLGAKQLLLVLDNMEHLLAGGAFLVDLLQRAASVRLLVTSRERLNLQAEYVLALKGLPVPADAHVAGASQSASVRLFAERAERTPAGFVLGPDNLPDVIRICALLDGLPLGIELAAAWVERLGCASIAETIVRKLDFMETSMGDVPQRHRSMRAVFEGSWQLLSKEEAAALARCAVFQGSFGEEAAAAVAECAPAALAALAAKSLLRRPAAGRYEMHDLLRQYAWEKMDDLTAGGNGQGEHVGKGEVCARHSAYYLDWLAQQADVLRGRQARRAVAAVQRDWGNVEQAWRWAVEQGQAAALRRASRSLAGFFQLSGLLHKGADLLDWTVERLAAQVGAPDEVGASLAALLVERAGLLNAQGWSEPAALVAQQAAQMARHGAAVELEAEAHLQRGIAQARRMDYAEARHAGKLAQALAGEAGARRVEAGSQLLLGQIEEAMGNYGVAQVYYEEALRGYQQVEDPRGVGTVLAQLGTLAGERADLGAARRYYERARAILHEMGDRHQESVVLLNLGRVAAREGDYTAAWDYDEAALSIVREIGDRRGEGSALGDMGTLLRDLGQYDRARTTYEQALSVWREIGQVQGETQVYNGLACLSLRQGQYAAAEELARRSMAAARESGERSEQARAANCLGEALAGQGRWEEAAAACWTALAQRRELGEQGAVLESLAGLVRLALARGDVPQAQAHAVDILASLAHPHALRGVGDDLAIYLACHQALEAAGDPRARELLSTAYRLLQERAGRIADPELRRSFLEGVAVNREIARREARWRSG